ncbi:MAG: hypothetical protein J1F32_03815 [Erysipelotrichales bacterium]|nr:hypothetical protein [Erysipelotrichales bacterium]
MNDKLKILIINAEEKSSQEFVKELYRRDYSNYLCVKININHKEWINKYLDNWKPDVVVCISSDVTKFVVEAVKRDNLILVCKSCSLNESIKSSLEKFYIVEEESEIDFGLKLYYVIATNKFGTYRFTKTGLNFIEQK